MKRLFVLVLILMPVFCYAGIYGKIAGRVVDAKTGRPIEKAAVKVKGTPLGTFTDANGYYVLIQVPVGVHTIEVSRMGYETKEVANVLVLADLTTTIDVELEPTVIVGKRVVVIASRPIIEKDVTTSRTIVTAEDLENMAVAGVNQAVVGAAGVNVDQEGLMHIRGGRAFETAFVLDGATLVDPFTNYQDAHIPQSAAEEISVFTGGFNAEYGSAQSGVISVVTKSGKEYYFGSFGYRTNDYSMFGKGFHDFMDRNEVQKMCLHRWDFSFGGPEPLSNLVLPMFGIKSLQRKIKFFISGEIQKDSGITYYDDQYRRSLTGKITFDVTPKLKIKIGGLWYRNDFHAHDLFTIYRERSNQDHSYLRWMRRWEGLPDIWRETKSIYAGITHTISPTTFYEIIVDKHHTFRGWNIFEDFLSDTPITDPDAVCEDTYHIDLVKGGKLTLYKYYKIVVDTYVIAHDTIVWEDGKFKFYTVYDTVIDTFKKYYGDGKDDFADWDFDGDVEINGHETPYYWPDPEMPPAPARKVDDYGYYIEGYYRAAFYRRDATAYTFKFKLTSQITKIHQIRTGFEYKRHNLWLYDADLASGGNYYLEKFGVPADTIPVRPYYFGAYLHDKMEFKGMIVNAGLRFDYWDANWAYQPADPFHPVEEGYENEGGLAHILNPTKVKPKWHLSPRIGISFPVTEWDKFHFTYGHYVQMPPYIFQFRNATWDLRGAYPLLGNPDIRPEITVSYECGVEHAFNEYVKVDVTGFYKDIRDLTDTESIYYTRAKYYTRYCNADYGKVRGFEVTFKKRPGGGRFPFLFVDLSYTYQIATGKSSSTRQNYDLTWEGFIIPKREAYLDWDQRHNLTLHLGIVVPKGVALFGIPYLSNFRITSRTEIQSGFPWTPPSSVAEPRINEGRLPGTHITNLRLQKMFDIGKLKGSLFMDIYNLFNVRDNISVLADSDWYLAKLTSEAGLSEDDVLKGTGYRKLKARYAKGRWNDPATLMPPRRITVGFEIKF